MGIKEKVKERVDKVKDNDMIENNILKDDKGNIKGVSCWKCEVQIAGLVDDNITEIKEEGGKTKVYIRQRFGPFDNHGDVEFELNNGEQYTPPVCKTCAKDLTVEDCEKILARHISLDARSASVPEPYLEFMISKSVKRKVR